MLYRSPEWSCTSGLPGWIFFCIGLGLIFLAARWSVPATSASMFSVFLDYIFRVCQCLWDSFLYLGKLHWFLYLLLSYFYDPGMFIFRWSSNFYLVFPTLHIIIVYGVNLNKLSRHFVGALRTTTTNCRVSFIDLYLVFPRNFKIVFLPHTNTVNLLEPYCGIITEPGIPVIHSLPPDITLTGINLKS